MRLSPHDRLVIQHDLAESRQLSRYSTLLIPELVKVDYDADTRGAVKVDYADGLGLEAENWIVYRLYGNIRQVDEALVTFGSVPPGAVIGDSFMSIGLRDFPMALRCYQEEHAYVAVDRGAYRVTNISTTGMGRIEEWILVFRSHSPKFRAPGY